MQNSTTIFLIIGMLIFLSATVVAEETSSSDNIIGVRQHPDKQGVWQVAKKQIVLKEDIYKKYPTEEIILKNSVNLKEWGFTEEETVKKVAMSSEQIVVLKTKKDGSPKAEDWFNFYQPTKELVVEKTNNIFSVKVVTEKEDTFLGSILIVWILAMLLYYFFLIRGFKRNNGDFFAAAVYAAAIVIAVAAAVAVAALIIAVLSVAAAVIATVIAAVIATVIATVIAAVIAAAVITAVVAESQNKRVMLIASFIYYGISLLLFYVASDLQHTAIPAIAVPVAYALTWKFVKYKNILVATP